MILWAGCQLFFVGSLIREKLYCVLCISNYLYLFWGRCSKINDKVTRTPRTKRKRRNYKNLYFLRQWVGRAQRLSSVKVWLSEEYSVNLNVRVPRVFLRKMTLWTFVIKEKWMPFVFRAIIKMSFWVYEERPATVFEKATCARIFGGSKIPYPVPLIFTCS